MIFKSPAGKEKAVLAPLGDSMLEVAHANGIEIEVGSGDSGDESDDALLGFLSLAMSRTSTNERVS